MGRLFWKVFAGFWLAMLLTAGVAALAVYSARVDEDSQFDSDDSRSNSLYANRYVTDILSRYAAVLEHGGEPALRGFLTDEHERRQEDSNRRFRPPVLIVNERGEDVLGRPVPAASLELARKRTHHKSTRRSHGEGIKRSQAPGVLYLKLADDRSWWLFMPRTEGTEQRRPPRPWWRQLSPLNAGLLALFFSLLFSGSLAWYLARPIRALRDGFKQVAEGKLHTRVAQRIGPRRDELADLGADFDKTTARLEALINAQKQLLHDVSHELRSPLARMQAATGLLEQSPDKARELIARIEQETARLDGLVGEILTLSRLDEQQHVRPESRFDLSDLLADLLQDARFEAEADGKRVDLDDRVDGDVVGDPSLIQRACENLVRNAIRYSPQGQTVLIQADTVTTTPAGKPGHRQIRIRVSDRGPGLAEAELKTVIEPFSRGSQAGQEGFGLGLAIARRAIEIHGGKLELANRTDGNGLIATLRWYG